jgi:hypothetical protein
MNMIRADVKRQQSVSAVLAHFKDRVFNHNSLSVIKCDSSVSQFKLLVSSQFCICTHVRCAITIELLAIHRTALITREATSHNSGR